MWTAGKDKERRVRGRRTPSHRAGHRKHTKTRTKYIHTGASVDFPVSAQPLLRQFHFAVGGRRLEPHGTLWNCEFQREQPISCACSTEEWIPTLGEWVCVRCWHAKPTLFWCGTSGNSQRRLSGCSLVCWRTPCDRLPTEWHPRRKPKNDGVALGGRTNRPKCSDSIERELSARQLKGELKRQELVQISN